MFLYVYSQRGVAQAELAWFIFFFSDFPTVSLSIKLLGSTAPMRALFEWGYDVVGSGPNLRAFAVVLLAGGLHWFVIGGILGVCFGSRHRRAPATATDFQKDIL